MENDGILLNVDPRYQQYCPYHKSSLRTLRSGGIAGHLHGTTQITPEVLAKGLRELTALTVVGIER
jgi:hypothetical protein